MAKYEVYNDRGFRNFMMIVLMNGNWLRFI